MAGGTWSTTQKPVLPGLYLNFRSAGLAAIEAGERGTVGIPIKADWGPVKEFRTITSEAELINTYSDSTGGTALLVRLALLGGARKVITYRITDGTEAKASITLKDTTTGEAIDVLKLEGKYPGAWGNKLKVSVSTNPGDSTKKDIKLYNGSILLKTFVVSGTSIDDVVAAINNDTENKWIIATKLAAGNGTLANLQATSLSGGASGITGIDAADYAEAFDKFETQDFNLFTLDGVSDSGIQTSLKAWIAKIRSQGKGVIGVIGGSGADDKAVDAVGKATARSTAMNYEGIVNVGTGAILNGVEYESAKVAIYIAGLIAGQNLNQSVTYAVTPFADVTRRWTRSEMEQAIDNGVLILYNDGEKVKVLKGINTLTSLGEGQNNAWKKIRSIRVMDAINADLLKTAEDNYIGKVNNTEAGRNALIGACKEYMKTLARGGVIESSGWNVTLDPDYYQEGVVVEPDEVYLRWEARLTDVMEKIFGTFIVK